MNDFLKEVKTVLSQLRIKMNTEEKIKEASTLSRSINERLELLIELSNDKIGDQITEEDKLRILMIEKIVISCEKDMKRYNSLTEKIDMMLNGESWKLA